ncbi:MAG: hypothetical protein MUP66_00405, partial [Candidatus Nanohaloarchaeota archaeon QJJ-5]|nr:hypothetical protein [Candidatus Nanohaloarchaeota archaeon QJJ-5]
QATRTPNGSVRQGKIIEALWETYTLTGNQTVRELAYNYTHGTPNDCDPWSGDHSCGSERGQGAMIDGMRAAYLATGNTTYRDQASSLVSAATSSPSDPELTTALWDVAGTTANTDAETAVNTTTNDTVHTCISDDCDPYPYAQTFETSMTAFSETDNETYHDTGYDLLDTGTNRTCDIWNQSYQCDDPDQQASMITAAWQGFSYFFSNLNGDITLDVTSSSLNPGDSTDLVCDVENVVADGADLVNVNITLETDSLTIEGNSSKEIDTIAPLTSANLTSSVSADSAGEYTITCNAESDGGWGDVTSTTISVEEEDTGGGGNGGSGSGGGGSGPITPPEPDPTILNETYDFSHQAGSALADQLDQHPQLRDSLGAILDTRDPMVSRTYTASRDQCLSGVRRYRGLDEGYKNTTLTLRYSCTDFLEEIMIFDTIPQQYSSYDDFSRETEEMEQLVLSTNPTQIAYTTKNITEGTGINITYRTQANGSFEFDPPIVVMKNHSLPAPETPPPPTIMMPDLIRNISSSYQPLSIETSNANQCSLDINDQTIERNFQPPYTYNSSFDVGWNTVTVLCEGEEEQQAIETYRVYRQPEQPVDRGTPVPLVPILGLLTVLLAAGGIYRYRGDIITPVRERIRKKQLQDQLDQMQEEFDQDNFDKVIEHYNKAKDLYTKLHGQPPSMSFWNQFFGELGMAMRVYLLLDLSEAQLKKGNTEKVLNTLSNLQRLYNRMKTDSSIENTDKVTKKARAFNRELRKHGEQFDV